MTINTHIVYLCFIFFNYIFNCFAYFITQWNLNAMEHFQWQKYFDLYFTLKKYSISSKIIHKCTSIQSAVSFKRFPFVHGIFLYFFSFWIFVNNIKFNNIIWNSMNDWIIDNFKTFQWINRISKMSWYSVFFLYILYFKQITLNFICKI